MFNFIFILLCFLVVIIKYILQKKCSIYEDPLIFDCKLSNKSAKFLLKDEVEISSDNKLRYSIKKEFSLPSNNLKRVISTSNDLEFVILGEDMKTKVGRISLLRVEDKRINVLECLLTEVDIPETEDSYNKFYILCAAIELTAMNRAYMRKK